MKKLLFIALLLVSFTSFAQDTFVRSYTSFISTNKSIEEEEKTTSLVVVFNADKQKKILLKFSSENTMVLYQVGSVETGKTEGGYKYQGVNVIDNDTGKELYLQLFDENGVLRLIFDSENKIEFYK